MPASSLVVRTQDTAAAVAAAVAAAGADVGNPDYPPAKGAHNAAGKKKKASFECSHCSRKFATRSHLVRHSRVHTGERRYACDYPGCEMRCSRKDNLQQHYRTHLVVNPRRANAAQSMLNAGPASASSDHHVEGGTNHELVTATTGHPPDMLISPTELKPLDTHSLGGPPPLGSSLTGGSAIEQTPVTAGVDAHGNPVERDWSPSPPPPPLSSAYDYWYAHGCLPHTVRNPASVSGSGSSGATSPEMSNALELAHHYHQQQQQQHQQQQHQHQHQQHHPHPHHHQQVAPPPAAHHPHMAPRGSYVESPTSYYHPAPANGAYYEGEPPSSAGGLRSSYPLATATFPTAAEYHHPPPTVHHHHGHQRSHSHSGYPMNASSASTTAAGSYGRVGGYESATTSPHIANAHLHQALPHQPHASSRHQSYSESSYNHAAAVYHSAASSPTVEHRSYHAHYAPHHAHSNSGGGGAAAAGGEASRPVTRHGSMSAPTAPTNGPMPVYPHSNGMMTYVPVDVIQQHPAPVGYGETPRHSQSVTNSPRMSSGGHFPGHHPQQHHPHHPQQQQQQQPAGQGSLILPPIRYSDEATSLGLSSGGGAANAAPSNGPPSSSAYALGGGHFGSAGATGGWERVSDARALPPHQSKPQ